MKDDFGCLLLLLLLFSACTSADYSPKPRGFFRIEFPEKAYKPAETGCPFTFEMPVYAHLAQDSTRNAMPCWKNLDFPQFNARLHISYFDITPKATFAELTEDARTFVFKHTAKATAIDQSVISSPGRNVHGLLYQIRGNAASNLQFYLSDSTEHYLRGALYFNEKPNLDSIRLIFEFLRQDIDRMIETFDWK